MADNQNNAPTAEELAEESQFSKLPTEAELRAEIVKEFGFDEATDKERIDKAVTREMGQRKITQGAIGAKIKHRNTATELAKQLPPPKKDDARNGGGQNQQSNEPTLSYKDSYALTAAGVHIDDVDEVIKASKVLGKDGVPMPIADTLKDPIVIARLADLAEKRKTANATNTDPARPGAKNGPTDEEVIESTNQGKIPKPGSAEAEQLFFARRGGRRK